MTSAQKVIKYIAIAFACLLIVAIISGILSAFYSILGLLGLDVNDKSNNEIITTNFENYNINQLDIEISASELIIKNADSLKAEINNDNITFKEENNKLQIKEKKHKWLQINKNQKLILYLPENINFENVNIKTGAGKVNIETIKTETLVFKLGAGEAEIKELNVIKGCKIEGGAGKFSILSGSINNLNLDMGVGETNLNTILTGKNEIDAGVGELNINLQNGKENYTITAEKGIGNIKIDGKNISNRNVYGDGINTIDVDGGIGNININFN